MGRLRTEAEGATKKIYSWSVDDRLLSAAQTPGTATDYSVAYTYDHRGERVSRADGADFTRYLIDDQNPTVCRSP